MLTTNYLHINRNSNLATVIAGKHLLSVNTDLFRFGIDSLLQTMVDVTMDPTERKTYDDISVFSIDDRSNTNLSVEYFENEHEIEESESNMATDHPVVKTIPEILRELQRELCLIKLCWTKIEVSDDFYARSLPNTYRSVSDKEKLLLWYAENFRRQFHAKYVNRKPLLLTCENECGIQVSKI